MGNPSYHKQVSPGNKWALEHIPYFGERLRSQLFWAGSDGFHASLQTDPDWLMPDTSLDEANHEMRELIIDYARKELDDEKELLAKVILGNPPYGKPMHRDNHWYRMLKWSNVGLVTGSISQVAEESIVVEDGTVHVVDVIIVATASRLRRCCGPRISGAVTDGQSGASGAMTPGFPNLFLTYGPNTNLAHGGSIIFHTECQVRYITRALREMIENGSSTFEVRPRRLQQAGPREVAQHGVGASRDNELVQEPA